MQAGVPFSAIVLLTACAAFGQVSLVNNGDFTEGLNHWTVWIDRDGQGNFSLATVSERLSITGSDMNGGVYQRFDVTLGSVVTVTGYWQSSPTLSDAMWAEVLVINADRVHADGHSF